MKIRISLGEKSIKEALQKVKKMQNQFPIMKKELIEKCAYKIVELANKNLSILDIGENVKDKIMSSWHFEKVGDHFKIINTEQKSVYVEFGTGIVGQQQPHHKSKESGYEYNVESLYKDEQGRWTFYQNLKDLDLPTDYSEDRIYFHEPKRNSERMLIRTSGAPASMFVFNAIIEFRENYYAKKIWEEIKKKYWG
jgi:hypothetical protein